MMWAIRSRVHLLKLSSLQCSTQLLRCQQQQLSYGFANCIHTKIITVDDIKNNNSSKKNSRTDSETSGSTVISTNPPLRQSLNKRKPKGRRQSRGLLRKLQQRVGKHISKPLATQAFHTDLKHGVKNRVITVDDTKDDLDDTWAELNSDSKYKRIYPQTVIPVATLAHGLERTLFKSGVHRLIDSNTKRPCFTNYLENITQPEDFDYEAVQPYITSSKDENLIEMARNQKARFVGSTSSLSGALSHLYFKVSNHRPVDISCLSRSFADQPKNHTRGSRVPKTIILRWKDGVYGVDNDKSFDTGDTILSHLGKSMEKVLTMEPDDYERYLKKNSSTLTEEERNAPEAYAYGRIGDLFLRSQLDCYHRNLPRRTFDLKTRATMPIRLDIPHYQDYYNYKLEQNHGLHYSFEREYYDMMRSAFLKYSFQVRIGHMDGIMVTYHNTDKIFGFQYIQRSEMDARLFGTSKMGDEVFQHCLNLLHTIFDKATTQYPKQTLRMTFDASKPTYDQMRIYIEPISEEQEKCMDANADDKDNDTDAATTNFADTTITDPVYDPISDQVTMYNLYTASYLNGKKIEGPVSVNNESDVWDVCYKLEEEKSIPNDTISASFRRIRYNQATTFLAKSDESPKFLLRFKLKQGENRKDGNGDKKSTDIAPETIQADTNLTFEGSDNLEAHLASAITTDSTSTSTPTTTSASSTNVTSPSKSVSSTDE